LVVATAGHIDHGKTSLVKALTGIDTDRLQEEKRRGITIELGFAHLGDRIAIIDVPGHERFVKTMAAGVSTVDLGLLVVAADDGVMPQTREHLAILKFLGVPRIFVVLTKISGVDQTWVDLVASDVAALLPDEYKEFARIFRCDSLSGEGLEELKLALLKTADETLARADSGVFRMPVDRSFSLKGHGTVAAGTILSGSVHIGDKLQVMPSGMEVRVRGLQSQGIAQPKVGVGQRAALNLTGGDPGNIQRGDWICAPHTFIPTDLLSVRLNTLPDASTLKNRDRVHVHMGAAEVLARVVLFGCEKVEPGGGAFAQIILETKTIAVRGDRFVIRRYSPLETLGGGIILDPLTSRLQRAAPEALAYLNDLSEADDLQALKLKVAAAGPAGLSWNQAIAFVSVQSPALEAMIKQLESADEIVRVGVGDSSLLVSVAVIKEVRRMALDRLDEYHYRHPDQLGVTRAHLISELATPNPSGGRGDLAELALEALLVGGDIILEKGYLRRPGHSLQLDPRLENLTEKFLALLKVAELNPPSPENLARKLHATETEFNQLVNTLTLRSRIARLEDGSLWTVESLREAWNIIHSELAEGPGRTVGQLRDALGCPRRSTVTLLEHFDTLGLTLRQDDMRLPGPRFKETLTF
jgi:selenocysteine-specific elongation factor